MRVIFFALLIAGCTSLTVEPDGTPESAQTYFARNVQPLLAAKCSAAACHGYGSSPLTLDYAALSQDLDDNFNATSNMILMTSPDVIHTNMTWNADARAIVAQWLQLESAARGQ